MGYYGSIAKLATIAGRRKVASETLKFAGGYKGHSDKQKGVTLTNWDIPDWVSSRPKDRIPEAWVGQQVVIHKPSGQELWVVLRDVRDFGVVYTIVGIPDRIFCPWSSIAWMRLAGADTEELEPPP